MMLRVGRDGPRGRRGFYGVFGTDSRSKPGDSEVSIRQKAFKLRC